MTTQRRIQQPQQRTAAAAVNSNTNIHNNRMMPSSMSSSSSSSSSSSCPLSSLLVCCKGLGRGTTLSFLIALSWIGWMGQQLVMENLRLSWWNTSTTNTKRRRQQFDPFISPPITAATKTKTSRRRTTSALVNKDHNNSSNHWTVKRNEFFLPPNESLWRYFDESACRPLDFTLHRPSSNFGQLPALWQCQTPPTQQQSRSDSFASEQLLQQQSKMPLSASSSSRDSKLIFVHLPRSAGNMVRSLLKYYAKHCQTSYAVILACADLSFQSAQAGYWYNGRRRRTGNHCQLREALHRNQEVASDRKRGYVGTQFLEQMDVIAGQLPLGAADQAWKYYHEDSIHKPLKVQYVIFFRDPVAKFVSQEIVRGGAMLTTTQSAVNMIQQKVAPERRSKDAATKNDGYYYDTITPTLVTPEQYFQYEFHQVQPTLDQLINVSMSNLVDLNVMIGIVERMPESLQLLQHVVDRDRTMKDLFQYFGAPSVVATVKDGGNKTSIPTRFIWPKNRKPGLSTTQVLEQIRKNETLYQQIMDYVKYEMQIYRFAWGLHVKQHQSLLASAAADITAGKQ